MLFARSARADATDEAKAEKLFNDAVTLASAQNYAEGNLWRRRGRRGRSA
jgi:predicted nucleic acid-binding protein